MTGAAATAALDLLGAVATAEDREDLQAALLEAVDALVAAGVGCVQNHEICQFLFDVAEHLSPSAYTDALMKTIDALLSAHGVGDYHRRLIMTFLKTATNKLTASVDPLSSVRLSLYVLACAVCPDNHACPVSPRAAIEMLMP